MNSGEDQSLRNLQEVADGILKKLFASGNQVIVELDIQKLKYAPQMLNHEKCIVNDFFDDLHFRYRY